MRHDLFRLAGIGLLGGILSGLLGIGAGTVVVPALVLMLSWEQRQAQGTAIAMLLPPVSILAALEYYHAGHVRTTPALLMALGLFLGGYLGGRLAGWVPERRLRHLFAALLFGVGLKMVLGI